MRPGISNGEASFSPLVIDSASTRNGARYHQWMGIRVALAVFFILGILLEMRTLHKQRSMYTVGAKSRRANITVQFAKPANLGLVLVDSRGNGTVPGMVLVSLQNAQSTAPFVPIELWIGPSTGLSDEMHNYLRLHSATIALRVLPKLGHIKVAPSLDLSGTAGGHVGKAYALLNTNFEYAVVFDGDVLRCPGWAESLVSKWQARPNHDLFWSHTHSLFGATGGHNDLYVSDASIDPVLEEYKHFPEHDSGSGVMVRKSNATRAFLRTVLELYVKQNRVPGMLRQSYTDQAAFREAAFLHRHRLQVVLLDNNVFC